MFQIVTETSSDLSFEDLRKRNVAFVGMTVTMNNRDYRTDVEGEIEYEWFIESLQTGVLPSTSQVNVGQFAEIFRKFAEKNEPVLYLAFSSGLSGTYHSAIQARALVLEDFPQADIRILDTLMASGGEGLLVDVCVKMRELGHSIDETESKMRELILKVHAWFTVDDLHHLVHGGRLTKTQAILGTLASIKPILDVDAQGKLRSVSKVRGRQKSLRVIAENIAQIITKPEEAVVFICHSGDIVAAEKVKESILEIKAVKEFVIRPLGPTIATHTGAGCVAVFAIGEKARV